MKKTKHSEEKIIAAVKQLEAGRAVKESPGPSSLSSYGNGSAATSASHPTRRFAIETNLILYAAGARVLLFRSGS